MKEKIFALIQNCCAVTEENIEEDTKFSDISLDSFSFVKLIVMLEEEFDIVFEDEQLNIYNVERIRDLIAFTEAKV